MADEEKIAEKEIKKELFEKGAKYPTPDVERPIGAQASAYNDSEQESSSTSKDKKGD